MVMKGVMLSPKAMHIASTRKEKKSAFGICEPKDFLVKLLFIMVGMQI